MSKYLKAPLNYYEWCRSTCFQGELEEGEAWFMWAGLARGSAAVVFGPANSLSVCH